MSGLLKPETVWKRRKAISAAYNAAVAEANEVFDDEMGKLRARCPHANVQYQSTVYYNLCIDCGKAVPK